MVPARQLCTFRLGELDFGIDVQRVQEVVRRQHATRVPLAPHCVTGLINLRGQIVTAIDLRRRLGMADRPADRVPMNVVIRAHDGAVSLLVDEIGDVLEIDAEALEAPPETLRGPVRNLTQGVCKLPERLLLVLDTERAVNLSAEPVEA